MNTDLETRHLRALIAVADQGTFTDAAIALKVSQSAVSRTISGFERIVGVVLVQRTTRAVRLTPAGEACYVAAVEALRAVDAVAQAATGRVRTLRIGYSWAAFGRYTSAVLRAWRQHNPTQPVEMHRVDGRLAGLRSGAVDLAVVRGDLAEVGLHSELLFSEGRLAAVAVGHPLATHQQISMRELAGETLVWTPSVGTTTLELWPVNGRPERTIEVDNVDEWLTVIAAGDAVGLTPESTAFTHPHLGVRFVPVVDVANLPVWLAWSHVAPHPAAAAFAAQARACIDTAAAEVST